LISILGDESFITVQSTGAPQTGSDAAVEGYSSGASIGRLASPTIPR
jgi:hypothetical protein